MGLMDFLQQYIGAAPGQAVPGAAEHFQQAAQSAPQGAVAEGVADALRSNQTPPFSQMVAQLFGQANAPQQAGMLNRLLASIQPAALAGLAGGALAKFLPASGGAVQVTPEQAAQLTPDQVQQIAAHAEQHNPSIIDQMGTFYAQHTGLVQTIGGAALTIVLAKIANSMRS